MEQINCLFCISKADEPTVSSECSVFYFFRKLNASLKFKANSVQRFEVLLQWPVWNGEDVQQRATCPLAYFGATDVITNPLKFGWSCQTHARQPLHSSTGDMSCFSYGFTKYRTTRLPLLRRTHPQSPPPPHTHRSQHCLNVNALPQFRSGLLLRWD